VTVWTGLKDVQPYSYSSDFAISKNLVYDYINCCGAGATTLPVVTLVLGGDGLQTIDQVKQALFDKRPVIIVTGSSRIPTLLAELFYVLEDKVPRSLVCT